jgi:hypothetical protein
LPGTNTLAYYATPKIRIKIVFITLGPVHRDVDIRLSNLVVSKHSLPFIFFLFIVPIVDPPGLIK